MSWLTRLSGTERSTDEDRQRAHAAVQDAARTRQQVYDRWPEVHDEVTEVKIILAANGFAPKIWNAMKERRT